MVIPVVVGNYIAACLSSLLYNSSSVRGVLFLMYTCLVNACTSQLVLSLAFIVQRIKIFIYFIFIFIYEQLPEIYFYDYYFKSYNTA